jgi:hypothetical protein
MKIIFLEIQVDTRDYNNPHIHKIIFLRKFKYINK